MARYLFTARYASDGIGGIVSAGGTARRTAVETMAASVGGRVESFDFAFGGDDLYTACSSRPTGRAAAVGLAANSSGVVSVRTVVLVTPEEIDAAAAQTVNYTPPGA